MASALLDVYCRFAEVNLAFLTLEVRKSNAAAIGLIPHGLAARIQPVGNAALDGASRLLLDANTRAQIAMIVDNIRVVELATDPYFADLFIKNMSF